VPANRSRAPITLHPGAFRRVREAVAGADVVHVHSPYPLGEASAWLFRRETPLVLSAERLPPHELAFALTVHKSQGSEYDEVLLVLPPRDGEALLTRQLLYTGLTRAKKLAVICGNAKTMRRAIEQRILRESGVRLWEE
jgi:ATP-dependent exoDNAse (exonuclease V) alpha subunit